VRTTEGEALPAECFEGNVPRCALAGTCRLSVVLARAMEAFFEVLDAATLQDCIANRETLVSILHGPPPRAA
jgi:Rrf2 family nitric oxide-sensitive transcriptional repressor